MNIQGINQVGVNATQHNNNSPSEVPFPLPPAVPPVSDQSLYRHVFTNLRKEFSDFLETIFFQLDTEKVLSLMDGILNDPSKSDDQIYEELVAKIGTTKKRFAPYYEAFKALPVLKSGMGKQSAEHLKGFEAGEFKNYVEISTRRYVNAIQKDAGLSFKNKVAIADEVSVGLIKRFEAGGVFYPYQKLLKLNDDDCVDYIVETGKTYKPLDDQLPDQSQDMIACLGGLHHISQERIQPFIQSLHAKLKPGAVLLLRDHDAADDNVKALASVVHSFVNAVDGVSLVGEKAEIRNFREEGYWKELLSQAGFVQLDPKSLVLKDDPTMNAMTAFCKAPSSKEEVEIAAQYQKKYQRSSIGSYSTWVEWGNVRFEKQYAEFIQNHHAYAFDYIGHIRQHWTHFYITAKCSLKQPGVKIKDLLFSDNTAMNLFIVLGTTADLAVRALSSFPSACIARWRYGQNWREVANLSALEKFEAEFKADYSSFIDYDPFFKYPYFQTIKKMWGAIYQSDESLFAKMGDIASGVVFSATLGIQGLLSLFINSIYYPSDETSNVETTHYLIDDPQDELKGVIEEWNKKKMEVEFKGNHPFEQCSIKEIFNVEGRKLISVPYYKSFTEITKLMANTQIKLIKTGGQEKITLDLCLGQDEFNPNMEGAQQIYQLDRLQDRDNRRYVTYEVSVDKLLEFCRDESVKDNIHYIHAHR